MFKYIKIINNNAKKIQLKHLNEKENQLMDDGQTHTAQLNVKLNTRWTTKQWAQQWWTNTHWTNQKCTH